MTVFSIFINNILPNIDPHVNPFMKEEEKKIWQDHQARLAVISRERSDFAHNYAQKKEALEVSYGRIPIEESISIAKEAIKTLEDIHKREHQEIVRYMDEIETYDRRRNPEPGKDKLAEPEKRQLSKMGSYFLTKFDRSDTQEKVSPEKAKHNDFDKNDP
jgi:hypothetical protein